MNSLFRGHKAEEYREDVLARAKRDKDFLATIVAQERSEDRRGLDFFDKIKADAATACRVAQQLKRNEAIDQQKRLEKRIAKDIQDSKREHIRDEKLRQLLRENSQELREFERQILEARVSKERALHKAQKLAEDELKREEEEKEAEESAREFERVQQEWMERERQEQVGKKLYHKALDEQKRQQLEASKEVIQETLKERLLIDQMLNKMKQEDLEEEKKRLEKREKYLQQIIEYQQAREEFNRLEQERRLKEKAKDVHFRLAQEFRQEELKEKQLQRLKDHERVKNRLVNRLEALLEEKEKAEYLRTQLSVEEKEQLQRDREQLESFKQALLKEDTKNSYAMQMWIKHQRLEQERKEEELFRKKMMDQLYKQDRLEFLSQKEKRKKAQEHLQMIQRMIHEKRSKLLEEKEMEMADFQHNREIELEKERLVAEEKQRILKENAADLLGFLPKRIIKDDLELMSLGREFQEFYKKRYNEDE